MNTRGEMLAVYFLPAIVAVIRLFVTIIFIVFISFALPLWFIQFIPLAVIGCSLFRMYRLYVDGIPMISLLVPTFVHGILCAAFFGEVPFIPLGVFLLVDGLFLFAKGFKPTQIPFQIEGQEEEDDFSDVVDI